MNKAQLMQLEVNLKCLKLDAVCKNYKAVIQEIIAQQLSYEDLLGRLIALEIEARHNRRITSLLKAANFPYIKTLDRFEFNRLPNLKKEIVFELITGNCLTDTTNLIEWLFAR